MNKKISVILPVKNGEKYLEEAINGIKNQNMNVEIIVVNDASEDSTPLIAKAQGCILIDHEICKGQVVGKNTGIKASSGEYILFHDADDVMREGSLSMMYEELENDPSADAVMTKLKDFYSPDLSADEAKGCSIKEEPYYGAFSGAVLIRKKVFEIIGLFNEDIQSGEIISWKMKLDQNNMIIKKLNLVSIDRRIHSSNFGRTNRKQEYQDYISILQNRMKK